MNWVTNIPKKIKSLNFSMSSLIIALMIRTVLSEITPHPNDFLFRPPPGEEVADLPSRSVVHLGTAEQGDHHVGSIEMFWKAHKSGNRTSRQSVLISLS